MPKVTNNTRETIDFTVGPGDAGGQAETESIAAGETKTMSVGLDNVQFRTWAHMGAITVEGTSVSKLDEEVAGEFPAVNEPAPKRRGGRRRKA